VRKQFSDWRGIRGWN